MPATEVEQFEKVLSILSMDEVRQLNGMPNEAIVGIFVDEPCTIETFRPNPRFIRFLHHVIRLAGPTDPDLRNAATTQGSGWVYLIDARTPGGPQGRVPSDDLIGGFKVEGGELVENGYWPNEAYQAFTSAGLLRLPGSLRESFLQALHELIRQRRPSRPA